MADIPHNQKADRIFFPSKSAQITAAVLCGGQSSRMGSDKGLLKYGKLTWLQKAVETLSALTLPVVVSANANQLSMYQARFPELKVIEDDSELLFGGPLKGILSIHKQLWDQHLVVLACDMPAMRSEVVQQLVNTYHQTNSEAVVFSNSGKIEPLCAFYSSEGLKKLLQLQEKSLLPKWSMMHALEHLQKTIFPVPSHWEHCFQNYNAPEDLSRL